MDVGDALSERISDGLEAAVTKYFDRSFDANVTVEKRGHEVITDCNVHLPSGIVLQSTGSATDPYSSLEESLEKMEKTGASLSSTSQGSPQKVPNAERAGKRFHH